MPTPEPLLVITNSDAGSADETALTAALGVLRGATSVEVAATSDPGELDGALHRAGSRRVVVAGGDGSLHAVVSALHRRHELGPDRVLGLLPLGTGNDFARTLGIPLDPIEAATSLLEGRVRPMDLLVDEVGQIVVNQVHLGAGAEAGKRGEPWKERLGSIGFGPVNLGRLGYPIGAALSAINPPSLRLRVEVDGDVVADVDHPVLMVALGNGATVGGGLELTPDADPGDGRIDVMIARPRSPLARLGYVARLGVGNHADHRDVITRQATTVIVSGTEFWCSADGEIYGPERHRSWRLEPAAYSMIVPG
ncbi:diacylglycerol kinase [Nocardioides humilatus]|uniref:Diacylglycerol kinase n=1 Tax=Nocardioides humilatus TaxID=2607660 RepID=A0A5B1LLZ7_9ACTN|nr:diacylglycerol kinase family protein [Nocardioides humilatus]KAA1421573.1 diacylglycerol kinase [Nocardioides humilatus]